VSTPLFVLRERDCFDSPSRTESFIAPHSGRWKGSCVRCRCPPTRRDSKVRAVEGAIAVGIARRHQHRRSQRVDAAMEAVSRQRRL